MRKSGLSVVALLAACLVLGACQGPLQVDVQAYRANLEQAEHALTAATQAAQRAQEVAEAAAVQIELGRAVAATMPAESSVRQAAEVAIAQIEHIRAEAMEALPVMLAKAGDLQQALAQAKAAADASGKVDLAAIGAAVATVGRATPAAPYTELVGWALALVGGLVAAAAGRKAQKASAKAGQIAIAAEDVVGSIQLARASVPEFEAAFGAAKAMIDSYQGPEAKELVNRVQGKS